MNIIRILATIVLFTCLFSCSGGKSDTEQVAAGDSTITSSMDCEYPTAEHPYATAVSDDSCAAMQYMLCDNQLTDEQSRALDWLCDGVAYTSGTRLYPKHSCMIVFRSVSGGSNECVDAHWFSMPEFVESVIRNRNADILRQFFPFEMDNNLTISYSDGSMYENVGRGRLEILINDICEDGSDTTVDSVVFSKTVGNIYEPTYAPITYIGIGTR